MNKKIYNTWDQIPLNALSISDLDDESINSLNQGLEKYPGAIVIATKTDK